MYKCGECQISMDSAQKVEGITVMLCPPCLKNAKCSKCFSLVCRCFSWEIAQKKRQISVIDNDITVEKLRISKMKPGTKGLNLRLDDLNAEKERTQAEIDKFEKIRHQRRQSQKARTGVNFEAFFNSLSY